MITLHDARHTSATTGADAGVPQHVMKNRLGHASRRTTDEVYTHVLDLSARKAAEDGEDQVVIAERDEDGASEWAWKTYTLSELT